MSYKFTGEYLRVMDKLFVNFPELKYQDKKKIRTIDKENYINYLKNTIDHI